MADQIHRCRFPLPKTQPTSSMGLHPVTFQMAFHSRPRPARAPMLARLAGPEAERAVTVLEETAPPPYSASRRVSSMLSESYWLSPSATLCPSEGRSTYGAKI